jgi:hypothetical protein
MNPPVVDIRLPGKTGVPVCHVAKLLPYFGNSSVNEFALVG